MRNNLQKIQLSLSFLFLVLSCLSFYFLYREINSNKEEGEQANVEWQMEVDRRDEIKSLDRSVKMIDREKTLLETHFAKSSDVVPFLDSIEGLASSVGTKAEVLLVDILENGKSLVVNMRVSGTFEAVYKFLGLLENSSYELEIDSLDIQRTNALDFSQNVEISEWDALFKIRLLSFIQ